MKKTLFLLFAVLLTLNAHAGLKKTYQWNMAGEDYDARRTEVLSNKGYTVDDLTLYGVGTDFGNASQNGLLMYGYLKGGDTEKINERYLKITLPKGSKDSLHWTLRTGANAKREWYLYYKVMDAGTAVTESLLNDAINYYTLNSTTAYVCDTLPGISFDFTDATKDKDVYFFFQGFDGSTMKSNAMGWRKLDLVMLSTQPDTITKMAQVKLSGIYYPANTDTLYISTGKSAAKLIGIPTSEYATVDTITVDCPAVGECVTKTLTVRAENGATRDYTYVLRAANFKKSVFDMTAVASLTDFTTPFIAGTKDTVINGVSFAFKSLTTGSSAHGSNFNGSGYYMRNIGTKYGQNAILVTIPANAMGYMQLEAQAGTAAKSLTYYAFANPANNDTVTALLDKRTNENVMKVGKLAVAEKNVAVEFDPYTYDYRQADAQHIYFFHNQTGCRYRTLTITRFEFTDANTELKSVRLNGVTYAADAPILYTNISNEEATLSGTAVSNQSTVESVNFTVPALGETTSVTLTVKAASGDTQDYQFTIMGAAVRTATFDYILEDQSDLRTSILAGNDYVSEGLTMKYMQGNDAAHKKANFGDNTGLLIREVSATYVDCGLRITVPKNSKGVIYLKMRPGAANTEYVMYALPKDNGTAAPTGWASQKDAALILGSFTGASTSDVKAFTSPVIDFSTKDADQDLYLFQTSGKAVRWQTVKYITFITEEPETETYERTVSNEFNTICLPYAFNSVENVSGVFVPAYQENNLLYCDEVDMEDVKAGYGYIYQSSKGATSKFTYTPWGWPLTEGVKANYMIGWLADNKQMDAAFLAAYPSIALIADNQVTTAAEGSTIKTNRAMIDLNNIPTEPTPAPVRGRRIALGSNVVTGLANPVNRNNQSIQKKMINGELVIIKDGRMFNAIGQEK